MKKSTRIILPIVIIVAGALITAGMILLKPKASRSRPQKEAVTVKVITVESTALPARVSATGLISASEKINLLPEVSGRIVHQSDRLIPGGRFKKGELMARIDSRDYALTAKQLESQVRQAELELQLELSRQKTAKREWELLGDDRPEDQASLALRKPHLDAAKENLKAAQSNLEKARLNLGRTSLRAPFNTVIVEENIDVGQVVGPSTVAAVLIGTDQFRVTASVPVNRLGLLEIPGFNAETGSEVTIIQDLGGEEKVKREGRMIGLGGQLDPQTRTAQILVALDDPLDPPEGQAKMLSGAYVDLEIAGRELSGVILLPRIAIEDGRKVWIVDDDNKLSSREITVGWSDENQVAVTDGIAGGDRVVITTLAIPVEGMPVSIQGETPPEADETENSEVSDES
jgi:RND family efflux transporter MFP subunit